MGIERQFAQARGDREQPPEPVVEELPKPKQIGKRTLVDPAAEAADVPRGKQTQLEAPADDDAPMRVEVLGQLDRDLAAIRRVALPAHAEAIERRDGDAALGAALTVQNLLAVVEGRVRWLDDHEGDREVAGLRRRELVALIDRGVVQGVFRRGGRTARRAVQARQLAARGRGDESLDSSEEVLDEVHELVRGCGSGDSLPGDVAARMSSELGGSFEHVRIHVGGHAAVAARLIHARAFTVGDHVYFDDGEYAPGTDAGDRLLRHELTHVLQHARGDLGSTSKPQLIEEISAIESEARAAEDKSSRPRTDAVPASAAIRPSDPRTDAGLVEAQLHAMRQGGVRTDEAPASAAPSSGAAAIAARKQAPPKPVAATPVPGLVDLTGRATFDPGAETAKAIEAAGKKGAPVRVRFGASTGVIQVKKTKRGYVTVEDKPQVVPLSHKLFVPLDGVSPVLRVSIGKSKASEVTGFATLDGKPHHDGALGDLFGKQAGAIGLVGFVLKRPSLTNELANGQLTLATKKPAAFELGGWVKGELTMAATATSAELEATARVQARGLADGELVIRRAADGTLRGSADLGVTLGDKFSGKAKATYKDGDVAITGTLGYTSEKFRGSLSIVVADAAEAEAMVKQQLDPGGVLETTAVASDAAPGKPPKAKKGERGIAGWGELDFAFTDWLTGRAAVVYGPSGHLTVIGKIAPPKRFDLMKQPRGIRQDILPPFKLEASYGLPYVADVHLGISLELYAQAELGPIYMTDMAVEGVYSTDPTVMNAFSISGALRAQAHAGLVLDVKGYGGLRILKHSINFGAGVKGEAGVRAYAEARPTLGYREIADPVAGKKGEYYLKGHLEMAAQPVLSLAGRLFVELDSPWWSPAPDKTWEWPIGSLEYPLPFQMGVGADIDYVLGSDKWPDLKLSEASFDPSKFIDSTMDDELPKKSGASGEQTKPGSWKQGPMTPPTKPAQPTPQKQDGKGKPKPPSAPSTKKAGKGKQTEQEKKNVPQSRDASERWAAGMEDLGKLRERAEKDPETSAEIHKHLGELKTKHGFTQLTAERAGDVWLVDAAMNPAKKDIPIKADPKDKPGAKPDDKGAAKAKGDEAPGPDKRDEGNRKQLDAAVKGIRPELAALLAKSPTKERVRAQLAVWKARHKLTELRMDDLGKKVAFVAKVNPEEKVEEAQEVPLAEEVKQASSPVEGFFFRGDDEWSPGDSVGTALTPETPLPTAEELISHVQPHGKEEKKRTARGRDEDEDYAGDAGEAGGQKTFVSFAEIIGSDRGGAAKFTRLGKISKVARAELQKLVDKGELRILYPDDVAKIISDHSKKAIKRQANNVRQTMVKNREVLVQGLVPGELLTPAKT